MNTQLRKLQEWYLSQCNEDWEHTYGITIDTLDNPGWMVKVDLVETDHENTSISLYRVVRNEHDWFQFEVCNGLFTGCGGPLNLEEILDSFLNLVGKDSAEDK